MTEHEKEGLTLRGGPGGKQGFHLGTSDASAAANTNIGLNLNTQVMY